MVEDFLECDVSRQSPHQYGIVGSFIACNLGTALRFPYDRWVCENPATHPDKAFRRMVDAFEPDMIVVTPQLPCKKLENICVRPGALVSVGVPVLAVWFDSAPNVIGEADRWWDAGVTKNILVDSDVEYLKHTKFPGAYEWLCEPRDVRVFFCENEDRTKTVSFIGSIVAKRERAAFLSLIEMYGFPLWRGGGQKEDNLTLREYVQALRDSHMTLNFTDAATFRHMTGRAAEAMLCGAFLLESNCEVTKRVFTPDVHYVPFRYDDGGTDLMEKLIYYAGHDEERWKIADAGRDRALEECDGRKFWNRIFEIAGVEKDLPPL